MTAQALLLLVYIVPAGERQLYYSEIDERLHLFGASEGWVEVGHIFESDKIG